MYLIDTNIFLEILLKQQNCDYCKSFLNDQIGQLNISDFTLHSIGVILFKLEKEQSFVKFISDTLPKTNLISLLKSGYKDLPKIRTKFNLDFDDSYQYSICKHFDLQLVTMDLDFKRTVGIKIKFL